MIIVESLDALEQKITVRIWLHLRFNCRIQIQQIVKGFESAGGDVIEP
jgi:hypothetical protein